MHSPFSFRRSMCALCAIGGLFASSVFLEAHGDDKAMVQAIIQALTDELAKAPETDLFIRRGELYRPGQEWVKADEDFASAAKLDPKRVMIGFLRARTLLDSGAAVKARPFAERYLSDMPDEPEAWFLRGEIMAAIGKPESAAVDYAEGFRRGPMANSEQLLRWAKLLASLPASDSGRVLAVLDEGIVRLGPVVLLVDYAIDLEVTRKNYDAALTRIASALQKATRQETWLVRQGDVLVKSGRRSEAVTSYRAALAAIERLSERNRAITEVEKLARDARDALNQLSAN